MKIAALSVVEFLWGLFDGVVFEDLAVFYGYEGVDPGVVIFAHEAVAAERDAAEEAVLANGVEHILGTVGAVMAAGAVSRGDGAFVKANEGFCYGAEEGGGAFSCRGRANFFSWNEIGVLSPRVC